MLKNRVIPCLLLRNDGLVKTTRFAKPNYVGDPINAIKIFNEKEVDEIIVLDIEASVQNREPNYKLIEEFASECFMPLCYGGGITTLEQAKKIFSLGVEKVSLKTAVLYNTKLITEIAKRYGNQSVVVSLDIKKNWLGKYQVYDHKIKKCLKVGWIELLNKYIEAGAGEIFLNAVDKDGTMSGLDLELIAKVATKLNVPLIAAGGANSLSDLREGVNAGASAVAAGAFFVYHGPHRAVLITYPKYTELVKLFNNDK
jgi:cyclase